MLFMISDASAGERERQVEVRKLYTPARQRSFSLHTLLLISHTEKLRTGPQLRESGAPSSGPETAAPAAPPGSRVCKGPRVAYCPVHPQLPHSRPSLPLSVNAWSPRSWIRLKSSPPSRLKKTHSERSGNQQITPPLPHSTAPRGNQMLIFQASSVLSPGADAPQGNSGIRMQQGSPLHDDQQALPAGIQVLIDIHDVHNVGALGGPPVQLHLSARLRAVLEHLQGQHLLSDSLPLGRARTPHLGLLEAMPRTSFPTTSINALSRPRPLPWHLPQSLSLGP